MPELEFDRGEGQGGFALIQILIGLAVLILLGAMAVPAYREVVGQAAVEATVADMNALSIRIQMYKEHHGKFPDALVDLGMELPRDPWGSPYIFLPLPRSQAPYSPATQDGDVAAFAPIESRHVMEAGSLREASDLVEFLQRRGERLSSRERITLQRSYADGSGLNTDFDLFSAGPDKKTRPGITDAASADDVVRAQDGHYFGVAEKL